MSILKKIGNVLGKAARVVLPFLPGGAPLLATAESARNAIRGQRGYGPSTPAVPLVKSGYSRTPPLNFNRAVTPMSLLPALTRGSMAVGGAIMSRGGAVLRNPTVQGAIGAAAGAALYDAAGNLVRPAGRRRRAKGITARELKSFTRVTGLLNKYCKTPPPMKRRTTRSKTCR